MLFPSGENDDDASRSAVSSMDFFKRCLNPDMPGLGFTPTDDMFVDFYLKRKVKEKALPTNGIFHDVNLYQWHPDKLAATYTANQKAGGSKEWYFFTPRDKRYKNGDRPNRVASGGQWKATGVKKHIKYMDTVLGSKMSLAFYTGEPSKRDKSRWLMDEFTLENAPRSGSDSNNMKLDDWVLCRIHKKQSKSDDTAQNQQPGNINGLELGLPPTSNERVATDINTNLNGYEGSMENINLQNFSNTTGLRLPPTSNENMATDLSTNPLGYGGSMGGFNQHNMNPSHVNLANGFAEVPQGCISAQGSFQYGMSSQLSCDNDQNLQTRNTVQSGQWSTQRAQFQDSTMLPGGCYVPVNESVPTEMNTDLFLAQRSFNYPNLDQSNLRDTSSQLLYDKDQNQQIRNTVQSGQWSTQRHQF